MRLAPVVLAPPPRDSGQRKMGGTPSPTPSAFSLPRLPSLRKGTVPLQKTRAFGYRPGRQRRGCPSRGWAEAAGRERRRWRQNWGLTLSAAACVCVCLCVQLGRCFPPLFGCVFIFWGGPSSPFLCSGSFYLLPPALSLSHVLLLRPQNVKRNTHPSLVCGVESVCPNSTWGDRLGKGRPPSDPGKVADRKNCSNMTFLPSKWFFFSAFSV